MIQLNASMNVRKYVPVDVVRKKLELASQNEIVRAALERMTFDQRHTKPITVTGLYILRILLNADLEVHLQTYTQNFLKWKFVPVNAYKPTNAASWIFFNTRQFGRRLPQDWEETLWHELVHIADSLSSYKFDHGDNDLSGDEETAPVKFARFMTYQFNPEGITRLGVVH